MGAWQAGHLEPGHAIDCPSGILLMHTFKKLPAQSPRQKTKNQIIGFDMPSTLLNNE
jgi:hypothetical protein